MREHRHQNQPAKIFKYIKVFAPRHRSLHLVVLAAGPHAADDAPGAGHAAAGARAGGHRALSLGGDVDGLDLGHA